MSTVEETDTIPVTRFQTCASVALGGMIGTLIALPFALPQGSIGALYLLPLLFLGGMIGYRRRESRAFLYFSFVAILLLSSLLSESLVEESTSGAVATEGR